MAKIERLKCLTQYWFLFESSKFYFWFVAKCGKLYWSLYQHPAKKLCSVINSNLRNISNHESHKLNIFSTYIIVLFRFVFAINDYWPILRSFFLRYAIIRSSWTYLIFFSFTKATFKQYLPCSPECLFIQQLFLLFLRTISLFGCSKIHRLDSVILRKNGSSCIFTSSGMLPIPKIFIKLK